jgi:glyceraldehyde 3-phosphate dehydrogenase
MQYMMKYDSVHGRYPGEITGDEDHLIVDGHKVCNSQYMA